MEIERSRHFANPSTKLINYATSAFILLFYLVIGLPQLTH